MRAKPIKRACLTYDLVLKYVVMKPKYEQYRANGRGSDFRGFRLPTELYGHIERLAAIEGDSVTGLVVEGLVRVIEDRVSPESLASTTAALRQGAETQIAALQEWAERLRGQDQDR